MATGVAVLSGCSTSSVRWLLPLKVAAVESTRGSTHSIRLKIVDLTAEGHPTAPLHSPSSSHSGGSRVLDPGSRSSKQAGIHFNQLAFHRRPDSGGP